MKNKIFLKWILISILCLIILGVSIFIELFFGNNNDFLWALSVCGITVSFLGFLFSIIMYAVNVIGSFLPIEQENTFADTFVQLNELYKKGLLTKEEFEKKKKQLWEREE